jgi:hypothetical protein
MPAVGAGGRDKRTSTWAYEDFSTAACIVHSLGKTGPPPTSPVLPLEGTIVPKVSKPRFQEIVRNSPDLSKGIYKTGMSQFESCRVSQAVDLLKIVVNQITKTPLNIGFIAVCPVSPGS